MGSKLFIRDSYERLLYEAHRAWGAVLAPDSERSMLSILVQNFDICILVGLSWAS